MTAYFTEPMSEEFKRAMEDAMKEMDENGKPKKKRSRVAPKRKIAKGKKKKT
jgi:hypothetical protein